jgi:hypothetical protein
MALWPEVGGSAPQNWAYGLAQGIIGRSTPMERNGRGSPPLTSEPQAEGRKLGRRSS